MGVLGPSDSNDWSVSSQQECQAPAGSSGAHTCFPVSTMPPKLAGPLGRLLPAACWSPCCQPGCLGTLPGHCSVTKEKAKLAMKTAWIRM